MSAGLQGGGLGAPRWRRPARASLCLALALVAGCSAGAAGATSAGPSALPSTAPAAVHSASGVDVPGMTVFASADRRPVPDVSGPTLDGAALRLRDLVGGVVVVNVWASWCTSCRAESALLAAAARDTAGVRFVGIDEADSAPAARRFVAASGTTYPQLADPDGVLLQQLTLLPSSGIPSTLLLDATGRMAARIIGPVSDGDLRRLIAAAQSEA